MNAPTQQKVDYDFIMKPEERDLYDRYVQPARVYVEYGMGGSTFRAAEMSHAQIFSVDSDAQWVAKVKESTTLKLLKVPPERLHLFHVDVGPIGDWGFPVDSTHKHLFPAYSQHLFTQVDGETVDVVLIDGRFRVACALVTLLNCHKNLNVRVLIHDFWIRERYFTLFRFFKEIESAGSLVVLQIKNNLNLTEVTEYYEKYKFDPA